MEDRGRGSASGSIWQQPIDSSFTYAERRDSSHASPVQSFAQTPRFSQHYPQNYSDGACVYPAHQALYYSSSYSVGSGQDAYDLSQYHVRPSDVDITDIDRIAAPRDAEPWHPSAGQQAQNLIYRPSRFEASVNATRDTAMSDPPPPQERMERFSDDQTPTRTSDAADSGVYSSRPTARRARLSNTYNDDNDDDDGDDTYTPPLHPSAGLLKAQASPRGAPSARRGENRSVPYRRNRAKSDAGACYTCGRPSKNPSDARKHSLQHQKPYKCNTSGCKRSKEGFSTINDLERHKKSVHFLTPRVGSQCGYICQACLAQQAPIEGRPKWWPRLDNFKAHIKRKHADQDMQAIVNASKHDMRPGDAQTVLSVDDSGIGHSQVGGDLKTEQQSYLSATSAHDLSRYPSQEGEFLLPGTGGAFSQSPGMHWSSRFDPAPAATSVSISIPELRLNPVLEAPTPYDTLLSHRKRRTSEDLRHVGIHNGINVTQSAAPNGHTSLAQPDQPTDYGNKMADGKWQCKVCKKIKPRDCDLRKHAKRHTRPYGCTFVGCSKRFGSRNDWKRHENSQHCLQTSWRCDCPAASSVCKRVFHAERAFRQHLHMRSIPSSSTAPATTDELDEMCKRLELGAHGHGNFWCGFCRDVIAQPAEVQNAWENRSEHIGNHFDKENRTIDEWLCMETNKLKGDICKEEAKKKSCIAELSDLEDEYVQADGGEGNGRQPLCIAPISYEHASGRRSSLMDADGEMDEELFRPY